MPIKLEFSFEKDDYLSSEDAAFALYEIFEQAVEISETDQLILWLADNLDLQDVPSPQQLSDLQAAKISLIEKTTIAEQNWLSNCPEVFAPLSIGKLQIIPVETLSPEILSAMNNAKNEIRIIPGTGFGTGHHSTTAMLIEMLQAINSDNIAPKKILDLGTGSGILAIVAEKLFNLPVIAIDNDELALNNASDNLKLNACKQVELVLGSANASDETFGLVIANLYAELLIEFREELTKKTAVNSHLLMSGIMLEKLDLVKSSFANNSWRLEAEMSKNNWAAVKLLRI